MRGWERDWHYQLKYPWPIIHIYIERNLIRERKHNMWQIGSEQLRPITKHWPSLGTRSPTSSNNRIRGRKIVPQRPCIRGEKECVFDSTRKRWINGRFRMDYHFVSQVLQLHQSRRINVCNSTMTFYNTCNSWREKRTILEAYYKVYRLKKVDATRIPTKTEYCTLSKACDVTWPEKCKQTSADSSISSVPLPFVLNIYKKWNIWKLFSEHEILRELVKNCEVLLYSFLKVFGCKSLCR